MRIAKHMLATALIVCLCVAVFPVTKAVSNKTINDFVLHTALAVPCGVENDPDTTIALYFSSRYGRGDQTQTHDIWIEPRRGEVGLGAVAVTWKGSNNFDFQNSQINQRCPALTVTETAKSFSFWREQQGADHFLLHIEEKSGAANGYLDEWVNIDGVRLKSTTITQGRDAIVIPVVTQEDWLVIKNIYKINDTQILAEFSDPIAMAALKAQGGSVDIRMRIVDANGNFSDTSLQWAASEASVHAEDKQFMEITFPQLRQAEEKVKALGEGYSLKLYMADVYDQLDPTIGESSGNKMVDGIWSLTSKCPLIADARAKSDDLYRDYAETLGVLLNRAQPGQTVTLGQDMDVSLFSPILMIPAGVTLDLNGYTLTAPNVFSFGNIIDSHNGEGGIQISHDRAVSAVHLQQNNQDFPLYDSTRGAYRFFSYAVASAGKKLAPGDAEKEWVKFGVKIVFDAEDAYRLLLDEANADVTLTMELMVKQRPVIVRISEETIRLLAQTVLSDFSKRSRMAVTLTVYGLEELPDTSCLSLTPTLYSECDVQGQSEKMRYYAATPAQRARSWVLEQMENDTWFSFDYGGAPYAEHIGSWSKSITETEDGWTLSYTKDDLTAWSEIVLDEETACVEWTNYFKNSSTSKFLQISNIQAINSTVFVEDPQLTTAEGANNNTTDFQPIHVDLTQEPNYSMASTGGRSSQGAFPYFEIHNGNYGVMGGIGWTGNWKADFENADGTVSIAAGMQNVNTYLKKNEQMRTPMIMMMFYEGDQQDGHNAFRAVIQKRYTPVDESGKPITEVPVFVGINAANGESDLISQMQTLEQNGRYFDGLWIDATWFGDIPAGSSLSDSGWAKQVGSWAFNESYPNGNMLSVSNWLADRDKELLVWFEPERVYSGTTLYNQYLWSDGFLLSTGSLTDRPLTKLWNFANDTARDVMIDTISSIISTNRITWYRQDFNIEPEIYWEHADEPYRVGMTEIQYITNLYNYLDALVEKNPGLMIDNCASGGRRLDLEMMRRSVPLWRSDITTDQSHGSTPDNVRTLAYNLSWWLPLHGGGYPSYNSNTTSLLYDMRSHFTGAQLRPSYEDETVISQVIEEYFSYKDLLTEEYHILACGADEDIETVNSAYEYYGAQESRGFVMTFRPQGSEEELTYYKLKGLDPLATYGVTVTDTGETFTAGGYTLMNRGLLCRYPTAAHSLLITFVKQVPQV